MQAHAPGHSSLFKRASFWHSAAVMPHQTARKALAASRRVVVKIGSRVLVQRNGRPDTRRMTALVKDIAALRRAGREVIVVSSGAIASGLQALGIKKKPADLPTLQMAAAATTGYDDRNNVEQVAIASPTPGLYRIFVTHSGGLPGGPTPAGQWVSVLSSGDTPLPPKVTQVEHSPLADECLIEFECDPSAYLHLETTTNLLDETSWESAGMLVTESWSNSVLPECDGTIRFWRLRRETGE